MRSVPLAASATAILLLLAPLSARAGFAPGGAFRGTSEDEVFRLLFPGWNPATWLTPAGAGLKMADARTWKDPKRKERLVVVVEHWKGDMDEEERRGAARDGRFGCDIAVLGGRRGAVTLIARAESAVPCSDVTPARLDVTSYLMDSKTRLIGVKLSRASGDERLTLFLLDGGALRPVLEVPGEARPGGIRLRAIAGRNGKNAFVQEPPKGGAGKRIRWEWNGNRYERASPRAPPS